MPLAELSRPSLGFVSEVVAVNLQKAYRPQPHFARLGAMCLQRVDEERALIGKKPVHLIDAAAKDPCLLGRTP